MRARVQLWLLMAVAAVACALAPGLARAGIQWKAPTAATYYVHVWEDAATEPVHRVLTAGNGLLYYVTDAQLLAAGVNTAGVLAFVINDSATLTTDLTTGKVSGTIHWDGDSEVLPASQASVDELESGLPEPIAPTTVHEKRTWYAGASGYKSDNVREVKAFAGTLTFAACPALNPEADIDSVESVVVTGPASEAASTLTVRADGRAVHFNLSSVTTLGAYTIVVTGNSKDGQEVSLECLLKVR